MSKPYQLNVNLNLARVFVSVLMLPLASPLWANDAVGKVTLIKGEVTAQLADQPRCLLLLGSEIFLQDKLVSYTDAYVVIKMNDNSKLTMRPESELQVRSQSENTSGYYLASIKKGLRAVSDIIGQSEPNSTESRTTTIGIRGPVVALKDCGTRNAQE